MARTSRTSKPAPAVYSPPARRTRSKLKEKESVANNNTSASSSQPVNDAASTTLDTTQPHTRNTATATDTTKTASAAPKKKATAKSKATASSAKNPKASAAAHNITSDDSSDDNTVPAAPAPKTTKSRSKRQPTVDRTKSKVTKARSRKPTTKANTTNKKAIEQHIEEETVATPARAAPARRTRAALRAGYASPLAPVTDNLNAITRNVRSKKILKDATPLSIIQDENDAKDPDDWFGDLEQQPRIYRAPGASMEEISEREDDPTAEHEDMATASSDAEEPVGEDDDMVADPETENGSETEADPSDEEADRPHTPEQHMQIDAPSTARSFGLSSFFRNPLASVSASVKRALFRTPARESPAPIPALASPILSPGLSPSRAAHDRKMRNRNTPVQPREKNADKRHEVSEMQKDFSQLKREELEALVHQQQQQLDEAARLKEQQEAAQTPGQKRRHTSPDIIPARRPGEKGSFGMLDEYFVDDDSPPVAFTQSSAKRRKVMTEFPEDDTDDEFDFVNIANEDTPPTTLKRPRNGFRMAVMKEGGQDPMEVNHEHRVMHHENSFSRSPLRDSPSTGNKNSPKNIRNSPSTVYNGSLMAMPGDPGYKPENVFKMSEAQQQQTVSKDGKMEPAELKARAEEIAKKQKSGADITKEEQELLDKALRKFGHVANTGSFSSPEYDSDDDSIMSDDDQEEHSSQETNTSSPPKDGSMKPPPPPVPAHAQLPGSSEMASKPVSNPATPKTPGSTSTIQTAALARQRELAEKHKPKLGSRLQYVSRASSSPVQQDATSPLSSSLLSTPVGGLEMNSEVFSQFDKIADSLQQSFEDILSEEEKKEFLDLVAVESKEDKKKREAEAFAVYDRMADELSASPYF
ncbi:sporulation related domain protein [Neofusicoccum parvum]|uniref:Sporulation related domain protein n=1 Tax=Neofusicoccum parvum TaxID=310453 RepID=A0ACB5S6Q0_9PEZI|nr:sporulation related domain protein [Neofusicoccum parvum]